MPLILGAQSAAAATGVVTNSCRFDDGDAVQLHRAVSVEGNRKVWTISFWFKKGNAVGCRLFAQGNTPSQDPSTMFELGASGAMTIFDYRSSTYNFILEPLARLKDPDAWYHLCLSFDSTPSTPSSSSIKFFINGTQQTAFGTETYPSQDFETEINNTTYDFYVGAYDGGNYYDGYMAEFCLIDGTAYDADSFGQFNADSPTVWEPIDVSELTFGTNGFYLDFEDSSALGTDAAGSNNLTATNLAAVDQCVDTPVNNFCTINSLDSYYQSSTYSEGNCKVVTESGSAVYAFNTGTMGVTAGKWYWEVKYTNSTAGGAFFYGVAAELATSTSTELGQTAQQIGFLNNNTTRTNNTATAFGDTGGFTTGDIMGCALDMTNSRIFFAKNGVWMTPAATSGGDPTDGTGNVALPTAVASTKIGAYLPAFGPYVNASQTYEVNFGNPSYTNTSDAADGNGYGKFEYAPPTGFLALCTKNLGSDGG